MLLIQLLGGNLIINSVNIQYCIHVCMHITAISELFLCLVIRVAWFNGMSTITHCTSFGVAQQLKLLGNLLRPCTFYE